MGIIEGKLTIGPLRPGPVRANQPEPEPPPEFYASHKVVILSEDRSTKILEVSIDSKGNYRAELASGNYWIDVSPHIGFKGSNPPQQITIKAGEVTHHNIDLDTGMR